MNALRLTARSVAVLPMLLLVACAAGKSTAPATSASMRQLESPPPALEAYRIQVGDDLTIKFYRNPELNEDVTVRPDGMISLQLIDDVRTAGLTPAELDRELSDRYAKELAVPAVSVIVKNANASRVFVGGEVEHQGAMKLTGELTLFQAIQEAGGFAKTANRKQVVLIRRGSDGQAQGRVIDVRPVQEGTRPEEDVRLQPFDVVFVPRSKVANVNVFVEQYIRNNLPASIPYYAF